MAPIFFNDLFYCHQNNGKPKADIHNSIMDIHNSIMDISITELWISLITDIHNSVMDIYNLIMDIHNC